MANVIDGLHMIVDGLVEEPTSVFTESNIRNLLLQLVTDLNMELIFGPVFKEVPIDESKLTGDIFQDEGGLSAFCMVGTSHISVHVWPIRQHFSLDVFSCRTFDEDLARKTVCNFLRPRQATFHVLPRRQGGDPQDEITLLGRESATRLEVA
jgi:S-adenosylmethionine/arginine decarboxylase-like enzyme